ncbi:MAG TPA: hypothetical protein VFO77_12620, partial [Actinoplanes sp.]|nr:hypothetical protein [Actinoplanes sp.]
AKAEAEIATYVPGIVPPTPYTGHRRLDPDGVVFDPGAAAAGAAAVASGVPPREPYAVPHHPPPPSHDPVGGSRLAGAVPVTPTTVQGVLQFGNPPPAPAGLAPPPSGPGWPMQGGVLYAPGAGPSNPGATAGARVPAAPRSALPPGAIIGPGGVFSGGLQQPGGQGPSARLTPGGGGLPGVLGAPTRGNAGAAGARGVVGAVGGQVPRGQPGGRLSGRSTASRGEPDTVWEVAQGVPPVIEADRRPVVHDPGPGVIGRDR